LLLSSGEGVAMMAVLIFGAAAGIGLGLARFKVCALLPAILIIAAATFASGIATGLGFRFIGLTVLATIVSLQVGYLVSFFAAGFVIAKWLHVRAMSNVPMFLHAIRTEIGWRLRTELESPERLPTKLTSLLSQMDARETSRKN
jgi:hypothetical protein